jgi:hypothetical protein
VTATPLGIITGDLRRWLGWRLWSRLFLLGMLATGVILGSLVGLPWLIVITPGWVFPAAAVILLWLLLLVFLVALPGVAGAGWYAIVAVRRGLRLRDKALLERGLRFSLLASTCLAGVIAMEVFSVAKLRSEQRLPKLPVQFDSPSRTRSGPAPDATERSTAGPGAEARAAGELYLAVVGESSARGEPYQPWLSVGQIVGWQLEQALPGRDVRVELFAEGGLCLEQAVLDLKDHLKRHPDAIIVYAGHNEFQARYGWSRNVRHYVEEGPESHLALLDLLRSTSWTARLILATIDRFQGGIPPPEHATRELVDHPTCSPWEYRYLLQDYERRLDGLTAYATRLGSVPILIVPPCNDGAFEPNRSVLAGSTPPSERTDFAREFQRLRGCETEAATAAGLGYRRLIERHPEFAETHYRLGRLLARAGAWKEAKEQLALARDLDGLPMRCPSDFRAAVRAVGRRHGAILVDGPEVLSRLVGDGIPDDRVFHDAHHPNVIGYVALAQNILDQLHERGAFGWPSSGAAPRIELDAVIKHFGMDAEKWQEVCDRSIVFNSRLAFTRYDPTERLATGHRYYLASRAIAAGKRPEEAGIPGLPPGAWGSHGLLGGKAEFHHESSD